MLVICVCIQGLLQYQPFISLQPTNMVTYNYTLYGPVQAIHTIPTALESSSMVFVTNTNGIFVNHIRPSGGFDLMPTDFNHMLLLIVLGFMAVGVLTLRHYYRKKLMNSHWV